MSPPDAHAALRNADAARAGGYVLALAGLLVALGLLFNPVPAGGFEERPSVLANTPWWGPIHIAIAAGFVLCVLGSLLVLVAGGALTHPWTAALSWGAMTVGMIFFTGVALINGWVMHYLTAYGAPTSELREHTLRMPITLAWAGLVVVVLSWGRGIGSATGLYFLEPLIFANVPAFLWLSYYGLRIARNVRPDVPA